MSPDDVTYHHVSMCLLTKIWFTNPFRQEFGNGLIVPQGEDA